MRQQSLSDSGFDKYRKKTRKQQFLEEMDVIVPWRELAGAIEPYYPNPEGAGRRPVGVERMLRIHLLQHWFNLSDPAAEEALYDSPALRDFAGVDLGREPVPDETTICKFRHLMERHNLGDELFHLINVYLQENGMKVNRGTIVLKIQCSCSYRNFHIVLTEIDMRTPAENDLVKRARHAHVGPVRASETLLIRAGGLLG